MASAGPTMPAVLPKNPGRMLITAKLSFPDGVSGGQSLDNVLATWPGTGSSAAKVAILRAIRATIPSSVIPEKCDLASDTDLKWRVTLQGIYATAKARDLPPKPSLEAPCLDNANSRAQSHILVVRNTEDNSDIGCIVWNSGWSASAATLFIPSAQTTQEEVYRHLMSMQSNLSM